MVTGFGHHSVASHRPWSANTPLYAVALAVLVALVVAGSVDLVHMTAARSLSDTASATPVVSSEVPAPQEGRLVAVSPTSVTERGVDGVIRVYLLDEQTSSPARFTVGDRVTITPEVRNGAAFATAIAPLGGADTAN
jgi:hypothetical protein